MKEGEFLSIYNKTRQKFLAVREYDPDKEEISVYNEKLETPGLRADWRFDKVLGGYKIALDHADGEPEFRLALKIEKIVDLINGTKLKVIRDSKKVSEGFDLWAIVGSEVDPAKGSDGKPYYIISLAKDASTVFAIDAGVEKSDRPHVWACVAGKDKVNSKNQQWVSNPIST